MLTRVGTENICCESCASHHFAVPFQCSTSTWLRHEVPPTARGSVLCAAGGPTPDPAQFVAAAAELAAPDTQLLMAHEVRHESAREPEARTNRVVHAHCDVMLFWSQTLSMTCKRHACLLLSGPTTWRRVASTRNGMPGYLQRHGGASFGRLATRVQGAAYHAVSAAAMSGFSSVAGQDENSVRSKRCWEEVSVDVSERVQSVSGES